MCAAITEITLALAYRYIGGNSQY